MEIIQPKFTNEEVCTTPLEDAIRERNKDFDKLKDIEIHTGDEVANAVADSILSADKEGIEGAIKEAIDEIGKSKKHKKEKKVLTDEEKAARKKKIKKIIFIAVPVTAIVAAGVVVAVKVLNK